MVAFGSVAVVHRGSAHRRGRTRRGGRHSLSAVPRCIRASPRASRRLCGSPTRVTTAPAWASCRRHSGRMPCTSRRWRTPRRPQDRARRCSPTTTTSPTTSPLRLGLTLQGSSRRTRVHQVSSGDPHVEGVSTQCPRMRDVRDVRHRLEVPVSPQSITPADRVLGGTLPPCQRGAELEAARANRCDQTTPSQ